MYLFICSVFRMKLVVLTKAQRLKEKRERKQGAITFWGLPLVHEVLPSFPLIHMTDVSSSYGICFTEDTEAQKS